MKRNDTIEPNPLKSEGQSKATTRDAADRARPGEDRDDRDNRPADTRHPSQHGGVTSFDETPSTEDNHSPGPDKAPARSQVGSDASGKSRPGKTKGTRRSVRRRD